MQVAKRSHGIMETKYWLPWGDSPPSPIDEQLICNGTPTEIIWTGAEFSGPISWSKMALFAGRVGSSLMFAVMEMWVLFGGFSYSFSQIDWFRKT
ncbi:hypothetical protein CEXT_360691 [Caerostris extrusa]|uniref:Uncharacterized protein n=1 Tax=Caerostris extrusa TaxID=172846 RepID=A0AAV4XIB9_CAEEX|nr:hypothetical protein CEXT_360691 [Caerostris extrusa]